MEPLESRARRDHIRGHVRAKASKIALRHDDDEVDQRVFKPGKSVGGRSVIRYVRLPVGLGRRSGPERGRSVRWPNGNQTETG